MNASSLLRRVRIGQFTLSSWLCLLTLCSYTFAQEPTAELRRLRSLEFHQQSQQRTGLLVPMYIYPENIHTNADYNRLIELKRRYETVPVWVIVNVDSGPGQQVDANYVKAIDRLHGAGCVTLAYVATRYGQRTAAEVTAELARWHQFYPRVQGVFFDEMLSDDSEPAVQKQMHLRSAAEELGFWPSVANPGTDTPGRYFEAAAANVIVVHEGAEWPKEARLHGDYFGGYADYPPATRAVLVHSMHQLDLDQVRILRKYVRWIYITHDLYRSGTEDNPWDSLPTYLEQLFETLAK